MKNISVFDVIYMWFNLKNKLYNKMEHNNRIYLYFDGQERSDFMINKNIEKIFYNWDIYEEFCEIIPLKQDEFEGFISKWVGDTFGLKGFKPRKSIAMSLPM